MTEQLKTLMDRATDRDFAAVDLDAITGAGDRTVRRRRVVAGVAGVAVLAIVATGAVLLGGGDGDRKTDFVDTPFRTDVPMWTEGSTLHTPDATYDLGSDVISFARTSEGIVFVGSEEEEMAGVYSYTGTGAPVRIGRTDDPHLRSDPDEPYVGWLDRSEGDRAVILDQGTGEQVWSEPAQLEDSFPIVAIDGTTAYLADADEGPVRLLDLASRRVSDLPDSDRYRYFLDVEDGVVARLLEDRHGGDLGVELLRPDGSRVEIRTGGGVGGVISPGVRWVSAASETLGLYDGTTGEPVDLGALDDVEGFGFEWADADTLMVVAESEADADTLELMSCEIPAGACDLLMTIDDFGRPFSIGSTDLLWGLGAIQEQEASPDVATETSSTERPE